MRERDSVFEFVVWETIQSTAMERGFRTGRQHAHLLYRGKELPSVEQVVKADLSDWQQAYAVGLATGLELVESHSYAPPGVCFGTRAAARARRQAQAQALER